MIRMKVMSMILIIKIDHFDTFLADTMASVKYYGDV